MPLQPDMKLISVDDHLIEHAKVWEDRLPAALRERGPRVLEANDSMRDLDGKPVRPKSQVWMYEGTIYPSVASAAVAGQADDDFCLEPARYEDVRLGCYDPIARAADLDEDGIQASVCFPTFPGFAGGKFIALSEDKDLARACITAYNDFVIDEWCGAAPERFVPMIILPLWDAAASVTEIERTADKGAKAISVPDTPSPIGIPSYYTDHWDGILAAAQHADLPLCKHFGTSQTLAVHPSVSPESPETVGVALAALDPMRSLADILQSPVFHKFPRLKIALSEGGLGWIPYMLERLDHTWYVHRNHYRVNREVPPSELFARHVWGCFIDDRLGIELRHKIGVSQMMWECDYPHPDSDWPHSRETAAERLSDVPDDEVRQIVELNARKVFNFTADLEARTAA